MARHITKSSNIVNDVRNFQVSPWGNIQHRKHQLIKKLICEKSAKFSPVWEKSSSKPIYYESDRLYFDHYRKCYSSIGSMEEPKLLYKLPNCPKNERIEDALVCEVPTDKVSYTKEDYRSHLIVLSRDNYISLLDLDTGRTMRKVFLSNQYKFRHLSWNTFGQSVFVKANNRSIMNNSTVPVVTFIVFQVLPLRLHSHIALTKEVFKKSITDASVFQGLLIVMHSGNLVRLFSYDRLVEEHTTVSVSLESLPAGGIPVTVRLEELPPILFEIKCIEHNLWLGGVPLHYVYQPNHQDVYKICQLKTGQLAEKGAIPVSLDAYETDNLIFLSDESNRLVHTTVTSAQILKICSTDEGGSKIEVMYSVYPYKTDRHKLKEEETANSHPPDDGEGTTWILSSSGRIIKRRVIPELFEIAPFSSSRIYSIQYDNDLKILVATSLAAVQDDSREIDAFVCFHDDQTGAKLKTLELREDWDDTYEHSICVDLDTVVHIYKKPHEYCCVMYRLDRSSPEEFEKQPKR